MAHPTPVLFASKGFNVIACPWNKPQVAINQVNMINMLRENASPEMKSRYNGIMHTFWGPARMFIAGMNDAPQLRDDGSVLTFSELSKVW